MEMRLTEIPDLSIYGDGTVVVVRGSGYETSDPIAPVITMAALTPEAIQRLLGAADDAGLLGRDRRYGLENVYDLWTTSFTVTVAGIRHQTWAYALGFEDENRLAPRDEIEPRARMLDFYGRIGDLRGWLGADAVTTDRPYAAAGTRVFIGPEDAWDIARETPSPASAATPGPDVRPWPLDTAPEQFGAPVGEHWIGWRCAVLDAKGIAQLGVDTFTNAMRWEVKGVRYRPLLRPLLPDESGCPTE